MSALAWNCRGLGNRTAVHVLLDLVQSKKPNLIFLIETMMCSDKLQPIKQRLGFKGLLGVNSVGQSEGIALLWDNSSDVNILNYSSRHIDAEVTLEGSTVTWRFTGFYGMPDRRRRDESWTLLKNLAMANPLPWMVMGDFNDILHPNEKRGGNPQPRHLIEGFKEAVESSGLSEFRFQGYQYTWERSRGTPNWIEAKLDRILVSDAWREIFEDAKANSLEVSRSDHMPLFIDITPSYPTIRKHKFHFENLWLKDNLCRQVVIKSWSATQGQDLP